MKNKTMKNLILLSVFAISIFGINYAVASADIYYNSGYPYGYNNTYMNTYTGTYTGGYDTGYAVRDNYTQIQSAQTQQYNYRQSQLQIDNQIAQQKYYNEQQKLLQDQNIALQKQNLANIKNSGSTYTSSVYTQPAQQIQYVPQQQIQAVTQPLTMNYVPASAQGASVLGSTSRTVYTNGVATNGTGQYVSYDANPQAASVYGYNGYNNVPVVASTTYDPNGVTALSMNGSGGFLPTSVFQWFMFILLILAIVIVARIIIKKNALNNAHAVPAH